MNCIVSLATKNSRYVDGLARLSNSLRDNADKIDFLGFIHEKSVDAPLHSENPYGFKIHAIQHAIDQGYTRILWLDASVYAVAPVQPIFDIIEQQGYFLEGAGNLLGNWCNDRVLDYYGIVRDKAMETYMVQGGFIGLDIENSVGLTIWSALKSAYNNNLFLGHWTNETRSQSLDSRCLGFRHEQSCLSAIVHNMNLDFSAGPEYVQYGGIYDKIINDKIILKCQGI